MPSHRLVNIADEFADANRSAVLSAKSGSELLPYSLTIRPTTVGGIVGEFVCSGLPESNELSDLVYPDENYDIDDHEFDHRIDALLKASHSALSAAAEFVHQWTMQVKSDETGVRYVVDDGW